MRLAYHDSSRAAPAWDADGRVAQKRRTRSALVTAAAELIAAGEVPSMATAAQRADVSLATAYRYFPSAEPLAVEAGLEQGLPRGHDLFGPNASSDPVTRIGIAASAFQSALAANEAAARTMQRIAVSGSEGSDAALTAMRAGRRIEVIMAALEPLVGRVTPAVLNDVVDALCLVIGIDALVVARDVRGRSVTDAIAVSCRAARAIVADALAAD